MDSNGHFREKPDFSIQSEGDNYWPRNVGTRRPQREGVYEFAIVGGSYDTTQTNIMKLFADLGVKVIRHRLQVSGESALWYGVYYLDFESAKYSPAKIANEIKGLTGVIDSRSVPRAGTFFGYHTFPVMINENSRGIILSAESLLDMEENIEDIMGSAAQAMLYQEGRKYGEKVAIQINLLANEDGAAIEQNIRDSLKAMGFGILEYSFGEDRSSLAVSLAKPVTDSNGGCRSYFVTGTLAGILETMFQISLRVTNSNYDKEQKILRVRFQIE